MSLVQGIGLALLRQLDAETAHQLGIKALKAGLGPHLRAPDDPILTTGLCGLKLPNPVGLAAGFDKHAEVPGALLRAGFGFVECGTVTPLPQPGNPRPRMFRLSEDRAVINRYGFNSVGLEAFAANLARRPASGVVGANIGANKEAADRTQDYVTGLKRLWPLADYFTVNVSSPNTPGLRSLQARAALDELLGRVAEARRGLGGGKPIFLKVAPDLADPEIDDICAAVAAHGIEAIIVGNTTLTRPETLRSPRKTETGGLSGAPLLQLSTEVLKRFFERTRGGPIRLIGAGGIGSGADAYAKIRAGASAVQLYSLLALSGPGLIGDIKRDLAGRLKVDGFGSVADAVGSGMA
ncbi:MAG TPA: quinone-dependent dihydroorotate dehydrogenase [Caulobacteraceae bacterium]|nr:quinone-dependent dihydroorotate dehydrogenase [Caulobacteraceae bacterium]